MADSVIVTADPGTVPVVVNAPFQVCHNGTVYRTNEIAEVPEAVAVHWITCGWVTAK